MFIATQQKYIPAPAEPNVVVTHGAPLERESLGRGCYKHLAAPRPDPANQHTLTHHGKPWLVFNNGVYQNLTSTVQNSDWTNGDQRELFYSRVGLDHPESSMLVSARFESRRPVNN